MEPDVNSPSWWENKAQGYIEHNDFRDRPAEFTAAAKMCIPPVLDVGCAFGEFSRYLPGEYQYLGLDISETLITEARKRHPERIFIREDVMRMKPGAYGAFKTATAFQVLEHFYDSLPVMAILKELAIDRLLFSVPRGLPGPHVRVHDGHVSGWVDKAEFKVIFKRFGEVTFWNGAGNHICGMIRWQKPQ